MKILTNQVQRAMRRYMNKKNFIIGLLWLVVALAYWMAMVHYWNIH